MYTIINERIFEFPDPNIKLIRARSKHRNPIKNINLNIYTCSISQLIVNTYT